MAGLTRKVVSALKQTEKEVLDGVLKAAAKVYSDKDAEPNIEELSDLIIAHAINAHDEKCAALETTLKKLVVSDILSVTSPILDHHVHFLRALSRRAFGNPCTVWIFTTNYDLLFEVAAARTGVMIENGFSGVTERFFNPGQFKATSGEIAGGRFKPNNQLVVKLVKLHGSVSWTNDNGQLLERHPAAISGPANRIMVLPRRKKVVETLATPHDTLFAYASRVIGNECRYVAACGFNFGDEHINQHLFMPALSNGRLRLFTLNELEPLGVAAFKAFPSFGGGYAAASFMSGQVSAHGTDLWKFSNFVKLF